MLRLPLPTNPQRHQRFDPIGRRAGADGEQQLAGGKARERQLDPEPAAFTCGVMPQNSS